MERAGIRKSGYQAAAITISGSREFTIGHTYGINCRFFLVFIHLCGLLALWLRSGLKKQSQFIRPVFGVLRSAS
jgi:hypothetical protein